MAIRVLLLGFGFAGAFFHAPLLAALPEYELAGVVTRSRAEQVREQYPAALIYPTLEAALENASWDVAVVATPNDTHVPLAGAALSAGLHVVVDKPLAPSAEQARQLMQRAQQAGRLLTVYHNRRWDSDFLTLTRLLPDLGPVYRFESRFQRLRPGIKPGWREKGEAERAGGVLWDLGSHLIDQAIHLFGAPTRVYAETDVRRSDSEVVDDAFVALTHAGGEHSHLWMSWTAQEPGPRLRVLGRDGAFVKREPDIQEEQLKSGLSPLDPAFGVEPDSRHGRFWRAGEEKPHAPVRGNYLEFYRKFAQAVRGESDVPVPAAQALQVLETIEQALAALADD